MSMTEEELRRQMMRERLAGLSGTPTQAGPEGPAVSSRSDMGGRLTEFAAQNIVMDDDPLTARQQAATRVGFVGPNQANALQNLSNTAEQVRQQRLNRLAQNDNITGQTADSIANATRINNFAETLRQQRLAAAERQSTLADARQRRSLAELATGQLLGATRGPLKTARRDRQLAGAVPVAQALNQTGANLTGIPVNEPQNFLETEAQRNLREDQMSLGLGQLAAQGQQNQMRNLIGLGNMQANQMRAQAAQTQVQNMQRTAMNPEERALATARGRTRAEREADALAMEGSVPGALVALREVQEMVTNPDISTGTFANYVGAPISGAVSGILGSGETAANKQNLQGASSRLKLNLLSALQGFGSVSQTEFEVGTADSPDFANEQSANIDITDRYIDMLRRELNFQSRFNPNLEPYKAELNRIQAIGKPVEQQLEVARQEFPNATIEDGMIIVTDESGQESRWSP